MALDPSFFPLTRHLNVGDKVRFRKKNVDEWDEGTIHLIWLGIEECVNVFRAEDREPRPEFLFLALGDEVEVI